MGKTLPDGMDGIDTSRFFSLIRGRLDERARRLVIAAVAEAQGRENISRVALAASVTRNVVYRGMSDLQLPEPEAKPDGSRRLRAKGAGRRSAAARDPGIAEAIREIVEPHVRGNPESPLLWISRSLRNIAGALAAAGHRVSHVTVGSLLLAMGFTLQSCKKSLEHGSHPDRDAQFRHIADTSARFLSGKQPVISVDTKKKELVGNFKNGGREYHRKGEAPEVEVHDFVAEGGRATPYGVFDVANNEGFVNVGLGPDTSEFAVESIRRWWQKMGRERFPRAKSIYVTCDGGGSNGSRCNLWKKCLQEFADEFRLEVTVSHFPPGTSKWNKIEHKMFSFISMNWRGKPLTSVEVIVSLIAATRSAGGLRILSEASASRYKTGVKVSKAEMKALSIERDGFHPEWNYVIRPRV